MSINPLKAGALIENPEGIGIVARKMLRERAIELALIDGRSTLEVSKSDWEAAKRELNNGGKSDNERLVEEGAAEAEHDQMREAATWDVLSDEGGLKFEQPGPRN